MSVPEPAIGAFADMLDRQPAADYLGLSVPTLDRKRVNGDGPPYVKIGSRVRYRRADLDAWLSQRIVTSTSEAEARLGGSK
jgi:excisionase family DNA binding protein